MKEYKILEFLKYKFFSEKFFQVKGDPPKKLPLPQMCIIKIGISLR